MYVSEGQTYNWLLRLRSAIYGSENIPRLGSGDSEEFILEGLPELKMEVREAERLPV